MANYTKGPGPRTPQYEEENTYSNLLSVKYPFLNALVSLNFGYHNAHHLRPSAHWLNLPKIDEVMYPNSDAHVFLLKDILATYHRHRLDRITKGLGAPTIINGELSMKNYYGVIMNISFLAYDV